jgi:hypothetical protein
VEELSVQTYDIHKRWEVHILFSLKTVREENFESGDIAGRKVLNKY